MFQNLRIMAAGSCSRRSFHTSHLLRVERTSSNIQSAAEQFKLSPSTLSQALTHKSFRHGNVPNNERLQLLGRRSLEYFAVQANINKDVKTMKDAVQRLSGSEQLCARFDALGLEQNIQCDLPSNKLGTSVKIQTVQALVGAVYHEQGLNAAKEFVNKNIFV